MAAPRWKTIVERALLKDSKQNTIQLATLDRDAARFGVDLIPRVRSHVFRRFLSSPNTPSLPLIITSTDIRSAKATQLTEVSHKAELVWWLESTVQQLRIICDVYVVPSPKHPLASKFQELLLESSPSSALSIFRDKDWEADRVDLFRSMSPRMKASWCRPIPGSQLSPNENLKNWPTEIHDPAEGHSEGDKNSPEYEEAQRHWEFALENFATIIIDPLEVDYVDAKMKAIFRKKYSEDRGMIWEEEELVL